MNSRSLKPQPQLHCLHFRHEGGGATKPMIWASAATWVFRQKPRPRHGERGFTGFEVETLEHPIRAKQTLEKATGVEWEMIILWKRTANEGDGEGPYTGQNPWKNGWPA